MGNLSGLLDQIRYSENLKGIICQYILHCLSCEMSLNFFLLKHCFSSIGCDSIYIYTSHCNEKVILKPQITVILYKLYCYCELKNNEKYAILVLAFISKIFECSLTESNCLIHLKDHLFRGTLRNSGIETGQSYYDAPSVPSPKNTQVTGKTEFE